MDQVKQSPHVFCWSAKWLDKKEILSDSIFNYPSFYKKNPTSDLKIAQSIRPLIEEAEVIVAHNGDDFDIKWINTLFIKHGLGPVQGYKSIDTRQVCKQFKFMSNKLDFLLKELDLGRKLHHYGFQMWIDCMNGDKVAGAAMLKYNKIDVVRLESLYKTLLPYIKNHPMEHSTNRQDIYKKRGISCVLCGSLRVFRRGVARTLTGQFMRLQCKDCGKWMTGPKVEGTAVKGI